MGHPFELCARVVFLLRPVPRMPAVAGRGNGVRGILMRHDVTTVRTDENGVLRQPYNVFGVAMEESGACIFNSSRLASVLQALAMRIC